MFRYRNEFVIFILLPVSFSFSKIKCFTTWFYYKAKNSSHLNYFLNKFVKLNDQGIIYNKQIIISHLATCFFKYTFTSFCPSHKTRSIARHHSSAHFSIISATKAYINQTQNFKSSSIIQYYEQYMQ